MNFDTRRASFLSMVGSEILCAAHMLIDLKVLPVLFVLASLAGWLIRYRLIPHPKLTIFDKTFVHAGVLVIYILIAVVSNFLFHTPLLPSSTRIQF